jgi:hypothetical protein
MSGSILGDCRYLLKKSASIRGSDFVSRFIARRTGSFWFKKTPRTKCDAWTPIAINSPIDDFASSKSKRNGVREASDKSF